MLKPTAVHLTRLLLAALALVPATAKPADLLEIMGMAQRADSTYASARSQWAAAQERIPIGRAGLLPTVQVTASAQRDDRHMRFRTAPNTYSEASFNSSGLTLQVTQPLVRPQNSIVYEQAFTQAEQADAQLAVAAQDLVLRTAQAYFDTLLAQDSLALAQAQKTSLEEQVKQARRNFEVGTAPVTDVHEAQARFDLITAQEIAARNELELRRRALEQIIGREPPALSPLGPDFLLRSPQPAALDPWLSLAAQNNLQVKVARSQITFSTQEIDRNRAAHLPTVDVFANVSTNAAGAGIQGGVGNDTNNRVIGLQLAVPIYSGGAINARVREAIANEDRAKNDFETARRAAVFAARQAFLGMTNGTALVRALEAALVSTESQLKSTRVGQQVGVRTIVDVLNAQQILFSARRDLAQAKYNYVVSLLRLEAAIGELTEEDVATVNRWLDRTMSVAPPSGGAVWPEPAPAGSPAVPADKPATTSEVTPAVATPAVSSPPEPASTDPSAAPSTGNESETPASADATIPARPPESVETAQPAADSASGGATPTALPAAGASALPEAVEATPPSPPVSGVAPQSTPDEALSVRPATEILSTEIVQTSAAAGTAASTE